MAEVYVLKKSLTRWKYTYFLALLFLMLSTVLSANNLSESVIKQGIDEYSILHKKQNPSLPGTEVENDSMADHSEFDELKGPFEDGPAVTKACLGCHNKAGHAFMKNKHWTWKFTDPDTKQELGKSVLINNFCTNARGNEGMCAQCHAGYNMTDSNFDFSNQDNIDCLVCHESTGKYYKTPTTSGSAACTIMFEGKDPINWVQSAKSVTIPGRENCGSCHFFGGGGDNVKHGDLSSALIAPTKDVDVHMAVEGNDFPCTQCHVGEKHQWSGSRYQGVPIDEKHKSKPGMRNETASCASCHGARPHPLSLVGLKLNDHTQKVACETCHIPEFAKGGVATKVDWDWRTAGKTRDGEGYKDSNYIQGNGEHRYTYKSIKGDFKYAENAKPQYLWSNGKSHYTTIDTKFDPSKPVIINSVEGTVGGKDSRITPFKRMHTIQPYDKGNNTLVYMHLWGDDKDSFWGNYDFGRAIEHGMKQFDIPYSGEFGFIDTFSYWPINHMVAPEEKALDCDSCHVKGGRLKGIQGVYMPGSGEYKWMDILGLLAIFGTLAAVISHGLLRFWMNKRRKSA
jgi:octaheme c-type cytochrome (tetrathionate reductase family)